MADVGASDDDPHSFGSVHTALKLNALGDYLRAFTLALKNRRFRLNYIDAFAGMGYCRIKVGDRRLLVPGSASLAIDCQPPFHRIVFIEKKRRNVDALERLKKSAQRDDIEILPEDANIAIPPVIRSLSRRDDRAIVFLDPFGMQVEWDTLRFIAASHICDVWYLFSLSGFYRQAPRDAAAIDADKARALTRSFGTEEWRKDFYGQNPQQNLFGEAPSEERTVEWDIMLDWVHKRLQTIFAGVLEPRILYQTRRDGKRGAPLFALFFAVSNPAPAALKLAMRLGRATLKP